MNTSIAVMISQLPLVVFAFLFYLEFRRISGSVERIAQAIGAGDGKEKTEKGKK